MFFLVWQNDPSLMCKPQSKFGCNKENMQLTCFADLIKSKCILHKHIQLCQSLHKCMKHKTQLATITNPHMIQSHKRQRRGTAHWTRRRALTSLYVRRPMFLGPYMSGAVPGIFDSALSRAADRCKSYRKICTTIWEWERPHKRNIFWE